MTEPSASIDIDFGPWIRSSYSQPKDSNCVEVGFGPRQAGVRDSKAPDKGRLTFGSTAWSEFRCWVST
ncbi:DUF397 domain-containing protein [Lentzea sp. NBRC 102530]|uniref:DUF397 domain-containing protein n=1 Tax=Lentzea sp. NBRC 102530 TaxID=3032201 RepID=UPI002555FF81|nr:DUF397 domain-containing protein [Lentzea sp. NBRC 102530]